MVRLEWLVGLALCSTRWLERGTRAWTSRSEHPLASHLTYALCGRCGVLLGEEERSDFLASSMGTSAECLPPTLASCVVDVLKGVGGGDLPGEEPPSPSDGPYPEEPH